MIAVEFAGAAVGAPVDALASDTSISSLGRRSGGMMTTNDPDSGHGRGASGGGGGPAPTPNNNNGGGKSHSALINIVVPVVFVMVVVILGLAFLRYLLRRMRRSRRRGVWSLLMRSERKPELFEVCLRTRGKDRDGNLGWASLQPASVDLISGQERWRGKRSGHVDMGEVPPVGTSRNPSGKKHCDFMVGKRIDLSGKNVVEMRVAVLVAMPSPCRSTQAKSSDAAVALSGPVLEEGLCIGTAHTSF